MHPDSPRPPKLRLAVVGGGISGLAAAHRLHELSPEAELVLLEAGDRLGGVLQTVRRDEFLIERSADNFITNLPWATDLCRRIGFEPQLLETNPALRRAFVVRRGRLRQVPQGFLLMVPKELGAIATTPILSPWGKLRLACEYFVPRGEEVVDESVAAFARRRLGREAYERLVEPLVGGIYTANAEQLSLAAALPQFRDMERSHGSLIRAARAGMRKTDTLDSGARYSLFVAPRDGMSSLVEALAARLPTESVRLGTAVESIHRTAAGQWTLMLAEGEPLVCDAVVLATPAHHAARLVSGVDRELAALLGGIEYASSAVVALAYRREQITWPLAGFGFVVPCIERRRILAGSFASLKFPGRAPQDSVLVRVFVGGAHQPELVDLPDDELYRIVQEELADLIGARGAPHLTLATRWPHAMPQYHVGHGERVTQIQARVQALPGLALAGSAYRGVGIPQCIHSGESAAAQVLQEVTAR